MRLFHLLLPALLFPVLLFAQTEDGILHRINEIKMDSGFIYGEAREINDSSAKTAAFAEFREMYYDLSREMFCLPLDSLTVQYLCHHSGSRYHVLAYLSKDSLKPEETVNVQEQPELDLTGLVEAMYSARIWGEIAPLLTEKPYCDVCETGTVDIATEEKIINTSFLFLLRGNSQRIISVSFPGERLSGYKPGDEIMWVTIKIK